ncbi:MAG: glycosyltransferase family 2 protein [Candidatus Promineifilaceae bacterium]|jgi:(heptosyl)LPS beta-1,4-glucosyltransferase
MDPNESPKLTAIILTLNEEKHIEACIQSLEWTDEVLVFDSFSDDDTVALAEGAGAAVLQNPFENYAQQRNDALGVIETDWVFFVDADERATPDLGIEIRHVIRDKAENAWYVPRHNMIFGKLTLGAGWYPDYQLRLLRHGYASYERPVHEIAVVEGETGYLENPLIHYNYEDKAQFQKTQAKYTSYDAGILFEEGIRVKPHHYLSQPLRQFWWRYVTLKGYKDGWHGLRLSAYMAYYEAVKYWKLAQLWNNRLDE